jgi:excisionase family DNA binding protein
MDPQRYPETWRKLLYTRRQAMDTLGIGNTKFYELVGSGVLRARKLGKRLMIEGESLHELVRSLPRANIKPPAPRSTATERQSETSSGAA